MSHNWIFINSPQYRRFIERSRESRLVFWGAAAGLCGLAYAATQVTMGLTNPEWADEHKRDASAQLARMPMDAQVQARKNREHLRAMITDVTQGRDRERYRSMLDGKIHGTTHGTTMRPMGAGLDGPEQQQQQQRGSGRA